MVTFERSPDCFCAQITLRNTFDRTVDGWVLRFDAPWSIEAVTGARISGYAREDNVNRWELTSYGWLSLGAVHRVQLRCNGVFTAPRNIHLTTLDGVAFPYTSLDSKFAIRINWLRDRFKI